MKGSPLGKFPKQSTNQGVPPKPLTPLTVIQDDRESLFIREVTTSPRLPTNSAVPRSSSTSSSGRPSKVFEDLLGRLDKLKESLEISPNRTKPNNECGSSPRNQVKFDEASGQKENSPYKGRFLGLEYANLDTRSHEEKLGCKPGPVSFGPEQWETESGRKDKKYSLQDLEYSPSKKESYASQIDNFLTNETGHPLRSLSTSRVASTTQRSELTQQGVMEFSKPPTDWTHHVEKDLGSLAELRARYRKNGNQEHSPTLGILSQEKENIRPDQHANRSNSGNRAPQQMNFSKQRPMNDAVSRALYLVQARHAQENSKFQQRDQRFEQIKRFLDNQETGKRRQTQNKKTDPKLKMMHQEVNRLEGKLNQYHFTFKDLSDSMGGRNRSSHSRSSDPDQLAEGLRARSKQISKLEDSGQKKRIYNHIYESSKGSFYEASPRSRHNHSQSRSHDYMTGTRDGLYDSQPYYSKPESIKPPVSFEIPISTSGRGTKGVSGQATLKEAYDNFIAKKAPRKTAHWKQSEEKHPPSKPNHRIEVRGSPPYNRSTSSQHHQQSTSNYGSGGLFDQFKIPKGIPSTQRANMLQQAREQARHLGRLGGSAGSAKNGPSPQPQSRGLNTDNHNAGTTSNHSILSDSVTGMLMKSAKANVVPPIKIKDSSSKSKSPSWNVSRKQDIPVEIYCKHHPHQTSSTQSNQGWGSRGGSSKPFELHPLGGQQQDSSRGAHTHTRHNSSHWSHGVQTSEEKNRERARQQRATAVQRRERIKDYDMHRRTVK